MVNKRERIEKIRKMRFGDFKNDRFITNSKILPSNINGKHNKRDNKSHKRSTKHVPELSVIIFLFYHHQKNHVKISMII